MTEHHETGTRLRRELKTTKAMAVNPARRHRLCFIKIHTAYPWQLWVLSGSESRYPLLTEHILPK